MSYENLLFVISIIDMPGKVSCFERIIFSGRQISSCWCLSQHELKKILKLLNCSKTYETSVSFIIWLSVKHRISFSVSCLALLISTVCLFNDLAFNKDIIRLLQSTWSVSIVSNLFSCNLLYSRMAFPLTLKTFGLYFSIRKRLSILVTLLSAAYIWPSLKDLCFSKSKLTKAEVKFKPCTLWDVHAQDSTTRNCVLFIAGDVLWTLRYIELPSLFIGTHLLLFAMISLPLILNCLAHLSSNSKYIVQTSVSLISMCFTLPIYWSSMLIFVVNISLTLILIDIDWHW